MSMFLSGACYQVMRIWEHSLNRESNFGGAQDAVERAPTWSK
jgi:hypothetical protein